mmetsp:Transcript_3890/g.8574  ORF Transcript_3890/g.8574 Transcript_3890/m.8574 type:complete len:216 (-) Transcript_3890:960-1607(-)
MDESGASLSISPCTERNEFVEAEDKSERRMRAGSEDGSAEEEDPSESASSSTSPLGRSRITGTSNRADSCCASRNASFSSSARRCTANGAFALLRLLMFASMKSRNWTNRLGRAPVFEDSPVPSSVEATNSRNSPNRSSLRSSASPAMSSKERRREPSRTSCLPSVGPLFCCRLLVVSSAVAGALACTPLSLSSSSSGGIDESVPWEDSPNSSSC